MAEQLPSVAEFSSDVSKAEAPPPLPPNSYLATIRGANIRVSQKGTRYAEIAFHIDADQYPADFVEGPNEGLTLFYRRVSLEDNANARFRLRQFLEAIGAPMGKKIDVSEWVGHTAMLETNTETYEGVDRANINRVRSE